MVALTRGCFAMLLRPVKASRGPDAPEGLVAQLLSTPGKDELEPETAPRDSNSVFVTIDSLTSSYPRSKALGSWRARKTKI